MEEFVVTGESDHLVSLITIILNEADAHHVDHVVSVLETAGLKIDGVDKDTGSIEATGNTIDVTNLEKSHLFECVRTKFSYWCHAPKEDEEEEPI